jgi:hypothetical protein
MLTALCLGNFKAFAETQRMPIKPLTLIFGPNSAGKSSLIHSLLLAHHAINAEADDEKRLDVHRTQVGGESVDLGGFHQYVYHRDALNHVTWAVDLDVAQMKGRLAELLAPVRSVNLSVQIGLQHVEKTRPQKIINPRSGEPEIVEVPSGELVPQGAPHIKIFEINADGESILRCTVRPEGYLQLDQIQHQHPIFQTLVKNVLLSQTTTESISAEDKETADRAISNLVPEIRLQAGSFLPNGLMRFEEFKGLDPMAIFQPLSHEHRQEQIANSVRLFIPFNLNELINNLDDNLREEFKRLQYLGPLRSYPPRHLAFAQYHDPNWYAGGGYAWDEVRRNEKVRDAVNKWLEAPDRLQTPYRLEVRQLFDLEDLRTQLPEKVYEYDTLKREMLFRDIDELLAGSELKDKERQRVREELLTRWQDLDRSDQIIEAFDDAQELEEIADKAVEGIESVNDLFLIDLRTNTKVSHRDVGIGVSQVLPVLVGAYASRQKLIAIEQPEIHLHPKLQAELGDLFIESALGERRNTFLIETHSEHLMLRIMRRMRDTVNDSLPEGLPPIRPEDIAVLYVQPHGAASVVRSLELDAEGQLLDPFPGGFFEEGFRERFA